MNKSSSTLRATIPALAMTAAMLAGGLVAPWAWAHGGAQLDAVKAPHGGQVRAAGPLHLELVIDTIGTETRLRPLAIYLSDHAGQAVAAEGASGTITLVTGKRKVTAPLQPDVGNRLMAQVEYAPLPGMKAVVAVTLPGQAVQQARFTPVVASAGKNAGKASGHQH